jgi:hypothetical protein
MSGIFLGVVLGFIVWFLLRYLAGGLYTVNQNERAVKTIFGRADRVPDMTTLSDPIAEALNEDEKTRYIYPQVRVIPPGGPYFKWPWERVYKVSVATQTLSMAYDPDEPDANQNGQILEAVTKDQLNTGLSGQIRYRASERNLYAYLFGVKHPVSHVIGYFVSVLRERIANFEAPKNPDPEALVVTGISINDLRKNLRDLNEHMDRECGFGFGCRRHGGDDAVAPVAELVFGALVLTGQHGAGGGHKELQGAGRGHVRPDGFVAGFDGGFGLLVELVGQLVVGIGGGHQRGEVGNAINAVERTGRAERGVLGGNLARQGDEVIRIFRDGDSHGL